MASAGIGRINHPFSTYIQKIFPPASILFSQIIGLQNGDAEMREDSPGRAVDKHSSPTDDSCTGRHQASSGKSVVAPSTPTQPTTENPTRGRAKTASLTSELIKVRNTRRSPKDVPDVGTAENRKNLAQSSIHLADQDQTASALVEKISSNELSIGAIAILWSKEIEHTVSEIETELLTAFQERLKDCSMDWSRDATISRHELTEFCDDANINPPKFWSRVT